MLNLIRYADEASHPEGTTATGAEGYAEYFRRAQAFVSSVGGRVVWQAEPRQTAIGPDGEHWDFAFVVEYPSTAAFVSMISDPDYLRDASPYRLGSIADSRLIRMTPSD